jgi:hypothetical protein
MRKFFLILALASQGCTLIHEASHALVNPSNVAELKPYPSTNNANFSWGYIRYKNAISPDTTGKLTVAMPYIVDVAMYATSEVLLDTTTMPRWARLLTIGVGQVLPIIDLAGNLYSPSPIGDFQIMDRWGMINHSTMRWIGGGILVGMAINTAMKLYKAW